jgi:hypothetical protein
MKLLRISLVAAALTALASAQISPGNLVVVRVGDGTAGLSNGATPVTLDQFTVAGVPVNSIPMPTNLNGNHRRVTNSGTATSEGGLTQSADGRYLLTVGYDAAVGTASVVSTSAAAVARVIARTALDGTIDSTTALADAYSSNNIRTACSDDGTRFWTSGPQTGTRFVANLGDTSSIQLATTLTNTRYNDLYNGQLYCTSSTSTIKGISMVGTGLPTTAGQTTLLLQGMPSDASASNYDFFFADPNTVYLSDDRTNGSGGIQKWTFAAGTWSLQYVLAPSLTLGCRGLSGSVDALGVVTLYASTTETSNNQLVSVVDTGTGASFTTLATAGINQVFRGVRLVRCPSAGTERFGQATAHTSGTPTLGVSAPFVLGTAPSVQASGMKAQDVAIFLVGLRSVPLDLSLFGAQPGAELYVLVLSSIASPTDALGAASFPFFVPTSSSLCGAELTWQGIQVDPALAFGLPIATSMGMTTRVGI